MIVPYIYNGVTYNLDESSMIASDSTGAQFLVDQSGNMTPLSANQNVVSTVQQYANAATSILTGIIGSVQQNDLNKLNVQRAQQGLPPLNAQQYTQMGSANLPAVTSPNMQLILLGGLALAVVLALRK